ncbi:DNA-binding response regulator CtrA [Limimaricola hongkongensis DSM 17492]|uniref:DNA-binding response regulator CtrA n=2 Tax=Limimaricola hongkongensis TaxID=278132 RepID=A0A017HB81_9RHOB|nr:DNA-binding response regulator CtrA [Limimaricola hongkongensis DSM 17492]
MLTHANLNVYATDMGEEGIDLAKLYDYDLILLDLHLPDMDGHEVLRQLRLNRVETPILILSGDDDTESKLKGFGFGADDYLTKPFHRDELVARIHAIIRRSKGHAQSVIETGTVSVNLDAKTVEASGQTVHLTGKEYQMLELLSLRKGTTLTKEMFLKRIQNAVTCCFLCVEKFRFNASFNVHEDACLCSVGHFRPFCASIARAFCRAAPA